MKKSYLIFVFFLIFQSVSVQAQVQPVANRTVSNNRELLEKEFEEVKLMYLEMLDSPNRVKFDSISRLLIKNCRGLNPPSFGDPNLFIPWLKENIDQTDFTSTDQAELLFEEMSAAGVAWIEEYRPLYALMAKASREQRGEIIKPEIIRTQAYYSSE